ncbi:DNA-damage-inducible membrane protein [Salmonella bongori]|nr:DNA-damage-inducible membrane protein [Salmonella bongori]
MRWKRTLARLTARVTAASYWTSGGRRVVSQGLFALLFSMVYALAGEHIVALLTSLPQIQLLADRYLIWQVVLPLTGVWCYLLDGMFIGATRAAEMRNSMAVAAAGFALTLLALPFLGNHGLWLALTVFLALRGLSLAFIWRRHWRDGTWFARG